MSWNYRVMKFSDCVGVVEAYYRDGEINGWTRPIVVADTKEGLIETLQMMARAVELDQEVLENGDDLEGGKPTDREHKLEKALCEATDCYVTVVANGTQMELEDVYKLPEVVRWYALVDQFRSAEAKRRKKDVVS